MDESVAQEVEMRQSSRKSKKAKKAKLVEALNLIRAQEAVEDALIEASRLLAEQTDNEVKALNSDLKKLQDALEASQLHLKHLIAGATECRELLNQYTGKIVDEERQMQTQIEEERRRRVEEAIARQRQLEAESAKRLVRLAEEARQAEQRKKEANEHLQRLLADRARASRARREREEQESDEADRKRREVARQEIAKLIQEVKDHPDSTDDREWIKKMNQYGASARTIREQLNNKNPNVLSFREKMLKFT